MVLVMVCIMMRYGVDLILRDMFEHKEQYINSLAVSSVVGVIQVRNRRTWQ